MRKGIRAIAIAGAALSIMAMAPVAAQASARDASAASRGMSRQVASVAAHEVSAAAGAQPASGMETSFWESPQGGEAIQTDCINGSTSGVFNWGACTNNEDSVHNNTPYYARVHYFANGYGAYACMVPHSHWLLLSTSHYDFSYPGEGYQPDGADAGLGQQIADNAASEALRGSCS
jgi:hypothetical protein